MSFKKQIVWKFEKNWENITNFLHYCFAVHIRTKQQKWSERKELKREQEIGAKKQKQSSKR
jgi:hypothetical protein